MWGSCLLWPARIDLCHTIKASTKNIVGGSFQDLAAVIALVKDKSRIGVCFDTCHGFAAGYDLRTEDAYNETWRKFDEIVGLNYLKAFHVNDSMKELGSGRDLHQNIGMCHIFVLGDLFYLTLLLLNRQTQVPANSACPPFTSLCEILGLTASHLSSKHRCFQEA